MTVFYTTNGGYQMTDVTIEKLLGGRSVLGHSLETGMDRYELSRAGIPKKALLNLVSNLKVSLRSMTVLLNVTERTLQRKRDDELLDVSTSEQVIQIAEVYSRGNEVFGSFDNFQEWMNSENISFGGKKPIELLSSRYGAQMILDEVGRIQYGAFS